MSSYLYTSRALSLIVLGIICSVTQQLVFATNVNKRVLSQNPQFCACGVGTKLTSARSGACPPRNTFIYTRFGYSRRHFSIRVIGSNQHPPPSKTGANPLLPIVPTILTVSAGLCPRHHGRGSQAVCCIQILHLTKFNNNAPATARKEEVAEASTRSND